MVRCRPIAAKSPRTSRSGLLSRAPLGDTALAPTDRRDALNSLCLYWREDMWKAPECEMRVDRPQDGLKVRTYLILSIGKTICI